MLKLIKILRLLTLFLSIQANVLGTSAKRRSVMTLLKSSAVVLELLISREDIFLTFSIMIF